MATLIFAVMVIGSYLYGSISPSIIISNIIAKKDIREFGSGNAGSTNMIRTFGWKLGLLTFVLDLFKGASIALLSTYVSKELGDTQQFLVMFSCIAAILGHSFPIYYKFRGGKGVASTVGIFLVIMTVPSLGAIAASFLVILCSGMVSAGSIIGMILSSVFSFIFVKDPVICTTVVTLSALTVFLHRQNIVRIFNGTERKLSFGKKS